MDAWGDTGEKNSFGVIGSLKFGVPRLWRGGIGIKLLFLFNILLTFIGKATQVT